METLRDIAAVLVFIFDTVWLLFGLAAIVLAALALVRLLRMLVTWNRTMADVVGFKRRGRYYSPRVKFVSLAGELVTTTVQLGRGVRGCRKGATVRILYDPKTPNNAEIMSFFGLWFVPLVLTVLAALFVLVLIHNRHELFTVQ